MLLSRFFLWDTILTAASTTSSTTPQRSVTFKSKGSIGRAAAWYLAAYVAITLIAAALQGLYKAPIYRLFMETWAMGGAGETIADLITMVINCAVSFWVYFPILKLIFKK